MCVRHALFAVPLPVEASARAGGLMAGRGLDVSEYVCAANDLNQARTFAPHEDPSILPTHVVPALPFLTCFGTRLPIQGIGVYYGSGYDVATSLTRLTDGADDC